MKKLVLLLAVLCLIPTLSKADEVNAGNIFSKLPNLKEGIAYDIQGHSAEYFTTAEIANYKGFSLSAGYSTSDKIVGSLDYDLGGLEKLGINVPLLAAIDLRVGVYAGIGNISTSNGENRNKFAYGPEITIVSLKF